MESSLLHWFQVSAMSVILLLGQKCHPQDSLACYSIPLFPVHSHSIRP